MQRFVRITLLACLLLLRVLPAMQLQVPSEYSTIQAALSAHSPGDTIRVAPGVYLEHDLALPDHCTLLGDRENPSSTVIDAEHLGRVLYVEDAEILVQVIGFRLTRGRALLSEEGVGFSGSLLAVADGNCYVWDCQLDGGLGTTAVYFSGEGFCRLVDCAVMHNEGTGVRVADQCRTIYLRTRIAWNGNDGFSTSSDANALLRYCLIDNNGSDGIYSGSHDLDVENTTIAANRSRGIYVGYQAGANVVRSQIVYNWGIAGSCSEGSGIDLACCNVYGNEANYVNCLFAGGQEPDNTEIAPLFCDPAAGDWSLSSGSPCLPGTSACGLLVGAQGDSCTTSRPFMALSVSDTLVLVDEPLHVEAHAVDADSVTWDMDSDGTPDASGLSVDWAYSLPGIYTIRLLHWLDGDPDTLASTQAIGVLPQGVIRVPEDIPSLADAVAYASDGDSIRIAPGHHAVANARCRRNVVLIGMGDHPGETVLDAEGQSTVIQTSYNEATLELNNLTLTGAVGTALQVETTDSLVLRRCWIRGNEGRALSLSGGYSVAPFLKAVQCAILDNHFEGPLFSCSALDSLELVACVLAFNDSPTLFSAGLQVNGARMSCSSLFGNRWGWPAQLDAWRDTLDNHELNPLFLDPANGDWRVAEDSPLLAQQGGCGLATGAVEEGPGDPVAPAWFSREVSGHVIPVQLTLLAPDYGEGHTREWDVYETGTFQDLGTDPVVEYTEPGLYDLRCRIESPGGEIREYTMADAVRVGGDTHRVPADHASIGAALAAALPGDTVLVACGTYLEHDLQLGPGVYLTSESPESRCATIDAESLGRVVDGSLADSSAIVGFRLIHGFSDSQGGALYAGRLRLLRNCIFEGNQASSGGGAYMDFNFAPLQLDSCEFNGNSATYSGGALFVQNPYGPSIRNCRFEGNQAESGGGLYLDVGEVENSSFVGNTADEGGALAGSSPDASGCFFQSNTSSSKGGACYSQWADYTSCVFIDNSSQGSGGAIYGYDDIGARRLNLHNCLLAGNSAQGFGGAVYAQVYLRVYSSTIVANEAQNGAAFYGNSLEGNPQLYRSIVAYNTGSFPIVVNFPEGHDEDDVRNNLLWENSLSWPDFADYAGIHCNAVADPMLCDTSLADFHLQELSIARPGHNECGMLVGYSADPCVEVGMDDRTRPLDIRLYPARPNPFNSRTLIHFDLPSAGKVRLALYDLLGRQILLLHEGELGAGGHQHAVDGGGLASGVYFLRLEHPEGTRHRKILHLK